MNYSYLYTQAHFGSVHVLHQTIKYLALYQLNQLIVLVVCAVIFIEDVYVVFIFSFTCILSSWYFKGFNWRGAAEVQKTRDARANARI